MTPIALLCGSLQRASANHAALDAAAAALAARGHEARVFEGLAAVPPMNPDCADDPGQAVSALRAALREARGVIIAAPEYAGAIAGVVKNALDWIVGSGDLYGKPVALISAGTSGGVLARRDLVRTLSWQGAHVVASLGIVGPQPKSVTDPSGARRFTDEATLAEIGALVSSLLDAIEQRPSARLSAVTALALDAGVDPTQLTAHIASLDEQIGDEPA